MTKVFLKRIFAYSRTIGIANKAPKKKESNTLTDKDLEKLVKEEEGCISCSG